MKKLTALLMALLLLCMALPALAQSGNVPLYDTYPASLDDNAWVEVSYEYEVYSIDESSYPLRYVMDESAADTMAHTAIMARIPENLKLKRTDMDVTGFAEDGRAVLDGADETEASTVIERYEINGFTAVRVDMTGQGYEMIWIADGPDMYFFMYPLADEQFAQNIRDLAATFHLMEAHTPAICNPDDYTCTADESGVTITGYTGTATRIAIPSEIGGQPVVALGDKAFYEQGVTWVSIPDSVTSIGRYCFSGCTLLQTLTLPAGITEIPDGMLESCFRLFELDIPEGVTAIGDNAFGGNSYLMELHLPASLAYIGSCNFVSCENLGSFTIAEGNTAFKTLDGGKVLLSADGKRFIHYCAWQERTMYIVPAGVEVISAFAFGYQPQLRSIIVPEGVMIIEGAAFLPVLTLQSLMLPESATFLGAITMPIVDGVLMPDADATDVEQIIVRVCSDAVIIAAEGSMAQAHAEMFNLIFEAAQAAENTN